MYEDQRWCSSNTRCAHLRISDDILSLKAHSLYDRLAQDSV